MCQSLLLVGRLFRSSGQDGQADFVLHRQYAGDKDGYASQYLTGVGTASQQIAQPIDRAPYYARHGIYLLAEYQRYLVDEHIAYHTSGRTRDAAHDDGYPVGIAQRDALAHTHDGEQSQSDAVEDEERIVQMNEVFAKEDDPQ